MTKDEFIAAYCARSGVHWDDIKEHREAVPCDCGEDICQGWQMVPRDAPQAGERHE